MNDLKEMTPLQRRTMTGVVWSAVNTYGNVVLSFVVFLVLARLLSPTEFGLVAIASVFVDLVLIVSRGGLPEAVVQRPALEEEFADTAFWLSTTVGALLSVILVLVAPVISNLFTLPELQPVLMALAVVLAFGGVGAVHEARLQRTFAFKQLALRALIANLAAGLLAVFLALQGWGVWAMVIQRILATAATTILTWVTLGWIPRARFNKSFAREQWRFGSRIFAANLLVATNVRLQELIAAAFLTPAAVGYIRLSWRCIDLVSQISVIPLASVSMATYARVNAEEGRMDEAYLSFIRLSSALAFPCFLGMAAVAPVLIPLAFGESWQPAVSVLQLLCFTAVPFVASSFMWPLMAAIKRPGRNLQISTTQVVVGTVLSLAAAPFGVYAVTLSHLFRTYLVWPLALVFMHRDAGIHPRRVLTELSAPFCISLSMAIIVYAVAFAIGSLLPEWAKLVLLITLGLVTYVLTNLIFRPQMIKRMMNEFSSFVRKRAAN